MSKLTHEETYDIPCDMCGTVGHDVLYPDVTGTNQLCAECYQYEVLNIKGEEDE